MLQVYETLVRGSLLKNDGYETICFVKLIIDNFWCRNMCIVSTQIGCAMLSAADLSILGGVFGLFSFQSFFFVGEVSVVLLLASKTTVVVLCNRKVVVDVTLKNDSCASFAVKQLRLFYRMLFFKKLWVSWIKLLDSKFH